MQQFRKGFGQFKIKIAGYDEWSETITVYIRDAKRYANLLIKAGFGGQTKDYCPFVEVYSLKNEVSVKALNFRNRLLFMTLFK